MFNPRLKKESERDGGDPRYPTISPPQVSYPQSTTTAATATNNGTGTIGADDTYSYLLYPS